MHLVSPSQSNNSFRSRQVLTYEEHFILWSTWKPYIKSIVRMKTLKTRNPWTNNTNYSISVSEVKRSGITPGNQRAVVMNCAKLGKPSAEHRPKLLHTLRQDESFMSIKCWTPPITKVSIEKHSSRRYTRTDFRQIQPNTLKIWQTYLMIIYF